LLTPRRAATATKIETELGAQKLTESTSVSLPTDVIAEIRALVGKRGFSGFMARAARRELHAIARREFVDIGNKHRGRPATEDELRHAREMLAG